MKDPNRRNHLIVDPETKWIIEKIFDMAAHGAGSAKIGRALISEKVPTPGFIQYQRYGKFAHIYADQPEEKSYAWTLAAIKSILRDETYIGNTVHNKQMAQHIVYGLISNKNHFDSDLPIHKIKGAIGLFDLICDDGNLGPCNDDLICLYLYLSRVQWERGYHDDAFTSLDQALRHARELESLMDGQEHSLTAPLVSFVHYHSGKPCSIAKSLPDDWPWWHNPDYGQVELEIKADPRWAEWVRKTQL